MSVDKSLLRQAAERVRDAAPGTPTLEALRHLQACFGWETVLLLLEEAESNHDVCWHCLDQLEPQPAPHCEMCPSECDDEFCAAEGCAEQRAKRPGVAPRGREALSK